MKNINLLKKLLLVIFSTLLLMNVQAQTPDPNFYIFLCFGQSNMEGQGTIDPAVDNNVDSRFKILEAVNCSGLNRTKANWYTAVPPLCRCNTKLGPADYFGREMVAKLPANITIGIVHVAIAGCKIELFDKANPGAYINSLTANDQYMVPIIAQYNNHPYNYLVDLAKTAQKAGVIKGILLHQGESNTGDNNWPTKVKGVYDNLIADLGLNASEVPLLAGQVVDAAEGGQCASMNGIIDKLPNTIQNSYVISSSGLPDGGDNLHFSSASYRTFGIRYATQMLKLLPAAPVGFPTVSITAPTATSDYTAPASIVINATAADANGSIAKVEFFNGTTSLGTSTTAPYTYTWNNVAAGTYTITADATDNEGNKTKSSSVAVKVNAPQTPYGGSPHAIPGTIQFEEYDEGGNGSAYYDSNAGTSVPTPPNYRSTEDVDIETCTDAGGGYNIGYAMAGEWLEYTVNVAAAGKYDLTLRIACSDAGKTVSVQAKGVTIANNIAITNTGGWQAWDDVIVKDVVLEAGVQIIRVTIGSADYVNLNYMKFTSNATDLCPNDPNKTAPGTCGCGVADTDTDSDGTPDCNDLCPTDALKTAPGLCGCNIAEGTCTSIDIEIDLKTGWNMVGYPFETSATVEVALASIWDKVELVKNYEGFYSKATSPILNSLVTVNYGQGYYIKVTAPCKLKWAK